MPKSLFSKISPFTSTIIQKFTDEAKSPEETVVYIEETQTTKPQLTPLQVFMIILTVYSVIVSITLNTNDSLRKFLGFKDDAGIVSTIFSVFMVLIFGPVLYLLALLSKFFESFGTYLVSSEINVTKTWVEGLAHVATTQQGVIASLMTPFTWF